MKTDKVQRDAYTSVSNDSIAILFIIVTLLFMLVVTLVPLGKAIVKRTETGTVINKQIVDDSYLITVQINNSTKTYELSNNIFFNVHNSEQIYNNLIVNATYEFYVGGFEVDLFDIYPIIIEVRE